MSEAWQQELAALYRRSLLKIWFEILLGVGWAVGVVYVIVSQQALDNYALFLFLVPSIILGVMAVKEAKNPPHLQRAIRILPHVEAETMEMRLIQYTQAYSVAHYSQPPTRLRNNYDKVLIASLQPLQASEYDDDARNVPVFDPCSWEIGEAREMGERVQVYRDPERDDLLVIRTSLGLLCSRPWDG